MHAISHCHEPLVIDSRLWHTISRGHHRASRNITAYQSCHIASYRNTSYHNFSYIMQRYRWGDIYHITYCVILNFKWSHTGLRWKYLPVFSGIFNLHKFDMDPFKLITVWTYVFCKKISQKKKYINDILFSFTEQYFNQVEGGLSWHRT